jgi:nucleotidyltransferase/DNA polymerase involved in DNA repair
VHSTVFHLRLRDFELQAERRLDASLQTRPIAIISSHHQNGTVVSISKEAEEEGLRRGMKISLVRRMRHGVRLLPYNNALYERLNQYVHSIVQRFTPTVEPSGYGKFYMDMTGMERVYKSHEQSGSNIFDMVQDQVGLHSFLGISQNKLVSRISTSVVPDQIHRVVVGNESQFLSLLNSPVIPTVHQPPVWKLIKFLILNQVCQIQSIVDSVDDARRLFGLYALPLSREVRGQDLSMVRPPILKDHIMEQTVLNEDTNDSAKLWSEVKRLSEQVAFKLRQRSQVAKIIRLEIHYTDGFKYEAKGQFLKHDDAAVMAETWRLFEKVNTRRNRIRAILLDVSAFVHVAKQMELFEKDTEQDRISLALDILRKKYSMNSTYNLKHSPNVGEIQRGISLFNIPLNPSINGGRGKV